MVDVIEVHGDPHRGGEHSVMKDTPSVDQNPNDEEDPNK